MSDMSLVIMLILTQNKTAECYITIAICMMPLSIKRGIFFLTLKIEVAQPLFNIVYFGLTVFDRLMTCTIKNYFILVFISLCNGWCI